jgi:hypothetical protein
VVFAISFSVSTYGERDRYSLKLQDDEGYYKNRIGRMILIIGDVILTGKYL